MAIQHPDTRSYYLRMPRETHDRLMISGIINGRCLRDEVLEAIDQYLQKRREPIEAAKKEVAIS